VTYTPQVQATTLTLAGIPPYISANAIITGYLSQYSDLGPDGYVNYLYHFPTSSLITDFSTVSNTLLYTAAHGNSPFFIDTRVREVIVTPDPSTHLATVKEIRYGGYYANSRAQNCALFSLGWTDTFYGSYL
jgi:hypothetical protein